MTAVVSRGHERGRLIHPAIGAVLVRSPLCPGDVDQRTGLFERRSSGRLREGEPVVSRVPLTRVGRPTRVRVHVEEIGENMFR